MYGKSGRGSGAPSETDLGERNIHACINTDKRRIGAHASHMVIERRQFLQPPSLAYHKNGSGTRAGFSPLNLDA